MGRPAGWPVGCRGATACCALRGPCPQPTPCCERPPPTRSMAEICSAYPTSGALYFWSARLAGPKWAPLASWVTGALPPQRHAPRVPVPFPPSPLAAHHLPHAATRPLVPPAGYFNLIGQWAVTAGIDYTFAR